MKTWLRYLNFHLNLKGFFFEVLCSCTKLLWVPCSTLVLITSDIILINSPIPESIFSAMEGQNSTNLSRIFFKNTFVHVKLTGYKKWLDDVHRVGKNVSIKVEHFLFQVFFFSIFYLLCQGIHVRFSTVIWLVPSRCTQSVPLSLTGFGLWKECVRTRHYSHFCRFF